jgi:hypothetical protein
MKEFFKFASLHNFMRYSDIIPAGYKCCSMLNKVKEDAEVSIMKMTIAAEIIQRR